MSKGKTKISIIILTWNGLALTKEVLVNLAGVEVDGIAAEVVVVDNGSKDGTAKELKNYKLSNMGFKLIVNKDNKGFAGGNNVGIKDALRRGADYILLLNNDVIVALDILVKLLEVSKKDPKIGAVSPKMYFAEGFEFHKDWYKKADLGKVFWYAGGIIDRDNVYSNHRGVDEVDHGQYNTQIVTDFANGACVLFKKEVLEKIGLLDEKFFLYWEDIDLCERTALAGYNNVYTPATHIWHKVSSSTGGSGGETNDYFITRNRLIFGMRYSSFRTRLALFRDSLRTLFTGRKWQKRGVLDFYVGNLGRGSKFKK